MSSGIPIIRGFRVPLLQDQVYEYDPSRGFLIIKNFRGVSNENMTQLLQDCVNAGVAARLTFHQGDTATLETHDSSQQYTLDTWQLLGNTERVDIFQHPFIDGIITMDQLGYLRQYLENQSPPSVAFADTHLSALAGGIIQRYYELALRGSTEFENDAYGGGYVLRHTTNAPNRWTANVADFGVGQIYTTAQLLSETQNASDWIYPLPDRLAYKISNLPAPDARANYQWGWKKSRSTECTAADNRIDIATEYILEQWSTDLYTPY